MNGNLELAAIGNCQIAALIDRLGRIVWSCLPRLDGDPVLCGLLRKNGADSEEGVFAVDLQDFSTQSQRYVRNTAVVETFLHDEHGGALKITDYCPRFRARGRVYRPMMIVRIVEPISGRPVIRVRFKPLVNYGAERPHAVIGSHHIRFGSPNLHFRLTTNAPLAAVTESLGVIVDGPLAFIVGPDESIEESPVTAAKAWLNETLEYWEEWVRGLAVPFDWQEAVIRAAITLKLCTYEDTGAVLAALTTSIPEVEGTERTWDYRYCWLRDSFLVIQALNRLGATRTMEAYLRYIDQTVAGSLPSQLQPLYGIAGEANLEETIAPALEGFRGMGPVRVGNLAYEQVQNDVYGAVVLAARQLFFDQRLRSLGDHALFSRLEPLGENAFGAYQKPDAGPWEFRGKERVHTFSAVMCWAAVDRLARIAHQLGMHDRAGYWRTRATHMHARIIEFSWNSKLGIFTSGVESNDLDATALLLPELGFVEARDPRFIATLTAIERELVRDDLVYRYRHWDDFGVPTNTFTMCSFWYINALAAVGRIDEARALFERLLERRNAVGLFSEDIDPVTGEHWGNFPQTHSMVGIITSAVRLSRRWEDMM